MASRWPKMAFWRQLWTNLSPSWLQVASRWAQVGSMLAQVGPMLGPSWLQVMLSWAQVLVPLVVPLTWADPSQDLPLGTISKDIVQNTELKELRICNICAEALTRL